VLPAQRSTPTGAAPATDPPRGTLPAIAVLFFASGATGLVYEVTWTRMFTSVFGNTTHAVSAVLAAFLGGLALGSFALGRIADRSPRLLRLVAALEAGVALAALAMPAVLDGLDAVYAPIYRAFPSSPWILVAAKVVVSFAVLLVPTFLMGGTLPVLSRFLVRRSEESGTRVALLYAINTLGATLGCFATGFWLVEALGVTRTIRLTALANALLAAAFFAMGAALDRSAARRPDAGPAPETAGDSAPDLDPRRARWVLVAFGCAGFVSLALEVLWTRLLVFRLHTTVYAFATMLTTFLAGIGLGSLLYSAIDRRGRVRRPVLVFGAIEAAIGVLGLASIPLFASFESITATWNVESWREETAQELLLSALVMLGPTLLMGAAFPLVARIVARNAAAIGASVGKVYAVNTAGTILGSFLAGFVLAPLLGTQTSVVVVSAVALATGTAVLLLPPASGARGGRRPWLAVAVPWVASAALLALTPSDTLFRYYNVGAQRADSRAEILAATEGIETVTTVHRYPDGTRVISTGSIDVAGTGLTLRTTQKLQAHVPMLLHPRPRTVLQVGFGSGETSHIVTTYDTVSSIDVVEISRSVLDTSAEHFADINHGVVDHPKFRAIVMDAASYMELADRKYDVIMNDSIWPYYAGNSGLYTHEYFAAGRERLNPGGLMTSWLPVEMPEQSLETLLETFRSVFPHVSVWLAVTHFNKHAMIVGSVTPLAIDVPTFLDRFEREARADLAAVRLDDPVAFLDAFRTDESEIVLWSSEAPLHTLDRPILEFAPRKFTLGASRVRSYELLAGSEAWIVSHLRGLDALPDRGQELVERLAAARRATAATMRGLIEREEGRPDFAEHFRLALRHDPDHPGARGLLGEVTDVAAAGSGWIEGAAFKDLVRMADTFLKNDVPDKAVVALSRAVELDPSSTLARYNLANALHRLGRPEQALAALDEVLRRDAGHVQAYSLRGSIRVTTGAHEPGLADLTRAIELDPDFAEAYFNRAMALLPTGAFDRALADLDRALDLDPSLAEAHYLRGVVLDLGSAQVGLSPADAGSRALEAYTRAIELDPTHVEARFARGLLHARASRFPAAIADLSAVIDLAPGQAEAWHYRGMAYRMSGDLEQARRDLEHATSLDPSLASGGAGSAP
jgi:spermidine synthase